MSQIPLSIPITAICGVTLLLMSALVGFHLKLDALNQTTFEQHKTTFKSYIVHPFDTGSILKNYMVSIFIKKPNKPVFRSTDDAFNGE